MAREASITSFLTINNGALRYQSLPQAFTADVPSAKGATPGRVTATTGGVSVALTLLSSPGLCRIANLDSTNYVTYGKWDGVTFHPLGELLPGESYVLRLSRTILSGSEFLRLVANTASCECLVEAFERA